MSNKLTQILTVIGIFIALIALLFGDKLYFRYIKPIINDMKISDNIEKTEGINTSFTNEESSLEKNAAVEETFLKLLNESISHNNERAIIRAINWLGNAKSKKATSLIVIALKKYFFESFDRSITESALTALYQIASLEACEILCEVYLKGDTDIAQLAKQGMDKCCQKKI